MRPNPEHKATFHVCIQCQCSCGWISGMWQGKGAKRNAAAEWRGHRTKCEAVKREAR